MKRICLVMVALFVHAFGLLAQPADTSSYRSRKLNLEEMNFVGSYYHQNGDRSAVTGGIGTQLLSDYSLQFDLNLQQYNRKKRTVNWIGNLGVDYYTSASSDNINPASISSASSRDLRIYPSVIRKISNEKSGLLHQYGLSYSYESDYRSHGITGGFAIPSADRNTVLSVNAWLYFDQLKKILPYELRTMETGGIIGAPNQHRYPWEKRNTYSASFSLSRVINQRWQVLALLDLTYQHGFLSMPFHRIYFKDFALGTEHLPVARYKIPLAIRSANFWNDWLITRTGYRFYLDDWGMKAHTADIEVTAKFNPLFSISAFYRYYQQSAMDYFKAYGEHDRFEDVYYSSNYDLSAFRSYYFGMGLRWVPLKGLLGNPHWKSMECRYGHYDRSDGLHADQFSIHVAYKRS
jgi:hypothetical protein